MGSMRNEAIRTLVRGGKRFVLVEHAEYRRLKELEKAALPPLPQPDVDGNVPASDYVRALIALDVVRARRAAGLTQAELASRAGVKVAAVDRLEGGKQPP